MRKIETSFDACCIAEGFCGGEDATEEERIAAFQFLIDNGDAWKLQGWYGRTANALIEAGYCTPSDASVPDRSA